MPVLRHVAVDPRPIEVARRVADRPGAVLLWNMLGSGPSYVMCDPVECICGLDPEPALAPDPEADEWGGVPRWFGLLPYEGRRVLERGGRARDFRPEAWLDTPRWWRYAAVAVLGPSVRIVADDAANAEHLGSLLERPARSRAIHVELADADEPAELHIARVERALEYIRAGELYQVNLARRARLNVQGHAFELLAALGQTAPAPYATAFESSDFAMASTSPELFLRLSPAGVLETAPIKGTRPRGRDADEDAELRAALDDDPKERAELTMILDVERNDLGRVAEIGSVVVSEPPQVRTYGSVHHRVATVCARLSAGVSRQRLLEAMLPSGSVTGAPKVRAMEVIAELESHRRGLYTGAFGILSRAGGLELSMAIRTLCVRQGEGEYFAGGGIVADSNPQREFEETRWKAVQLRALLARRPGAASGTENWAAELGQG